MNEYAEHELKLIVTNDDGYGEPGLQVLSEIAQKMGEVLLVAPKTPQSFIGHRVTMMDPIRVDQPGDRHYIVHGAPADCTRLALKRFAPDADWVIAGINPGANLGTDVYQSGTVAAAREAAILGVKAIAVSQYIAAGWEMDWPASGWQTAHILRQIIAEKISPGQFWNINLPSPITAEKAMAYQFCPLDKHPHSYYFIKSDGAFHYKGSIHNRPFARGSDVDVCFGGRISITRMAV